MRASRWHSLTCVLFIGALSACSPPAGNIDSIITGRVPVDRMSETLEGTLIDVDGCASIALSTDLVYPVVWPGGFEIHDRGASVGDHHGRVKLGQHLSSKGYLIERAVLNSLQDPPAALFGVDTCSPEADTLVVLTQVEDFDSTE